MTCAVWRRLLFLLVLGLAGSGNLTPAGASIGGPFTGGAQQIAAVYEYDGQLSCTQDLRPSGSPLMSQRLATDPFGDQVEGRGRYDEPHSTSTTRLEFVATNTPKAGTAIESMWAQAPNDGFLAGWSKAEVLKPGTVIDRYGLETGRFLSPAGTALEARALPVGAELKGLRTYEVLKPLPVRAGVAAPAFGQPGLGIQYMTGMPVADLIKQGFVKAVGG